MRQETLQPEAVDLEVRTVRQTGVLRPTPRRAQPLLCRVRSPLGQRRRPAFFAAQRASPPRIRREDWAGRKVRAPHHLADADDVALSFPEDAIGIRLRDVSRHPDLPRRDSPKPGDCDAVTRPLHHLDRYGPAGRQPRGADHHSAAQGLRSGAEYGTGPRRSYRWRPAVPPTGPSPRPRSDLDLVARYRDRLG